MGLIDITKIPAVYINLEKHKEKNDNMYNVLSSIGFETIERIEGVLDTENPVAGCSKAHHKALSSFEAPFVLFEDDCVLFDQNTITEIEIPDNADALYLGISSWGRMNGHNGFYLQYDEFEEQSNLLRIYNMLGGHSIIYLTEDYKKMCEKVSYHAGYVIKDYQDIGFAEIQKFFNVYSLNNPMFYQTSNALGTKNNITSYHTSECLSVNNLQFYPYKIK
jgi:hypothetical protein